MNTKHTPGPWIVESRHGEVQINSVEMYCGSRAYIGMPLATVHIIPPDERAAPDGSNVLPREANARLIAAAPQQNAALIKAERFISGFEGDETQEGIDELLLEIRAAIAKATGN